MQTVFAQMAMSLDGHIRVVPSPGVTHVRYGVVR